jgi:hypothetical protein
MFWGVVLDLDKYICPWQKCFLVGFRVGSLYNWVNVKADALVKGSTYSRFFLKGERIAVHEK